MKIKLLYICYVILFVVIVVKLFYIQVLNAHAFSGDYLVTKKIKPERGKIFDTNQKPLAINQTSYLLYAEPKNIEDKSYVVTKLDQILKLGESTLSGRIDLSKVWVSVKDGIDEDTKNQISSLKLKGIGFQEETQRYYPEASLSSHLIGFVGKNERSDSVGYFGIEGYYDKELAGLPGLLKSERDLIGRPIFFGTQERMEQEDGRDLVLTVDNAVQNIIKKRLIAGLENYKSSQGCVIVADPNTMAILGLTCLPDFDPSKYYDYTEEVFKNPAITNLYEPGSTFKPLVVAAALQEKAIKPDEILPEPGPMEVGGYTIRTWNDKYEGQVSVTRILEKSSNVGMVAIGDKLGKGKLYDYVQKYGFGQTTDIDLQGEVGGYLKPKNEWYPIDFATVTFGQGIAVTPLQMIRAFSAAINGGKLLQPYIVGKTISEDGERQREPKIIRHIVSPLVSEILKKMLISTVENGDSKWAKPKGYIIGGKTGTAQVAIQGKYDPSKTIASFIGFAPAENPKFIAIVVLKEPKTSIWGSETAAPLFFDIAKDLLVYYNISPNSQ